MEQPDMIRFTPVGVRMKEILSPRIRPRSEMQMRRTLLPVASRDGAAALEAAAEVAGLAISDLWLQYFALGGLASPAGLSAMLSGREAMSREDHDRLALVINERLDQAGLGRPLAYSDGSR